MTFRGAGRRLASRPDAPIIASLFLGTLLLRVATAANTVTFSDSGDFLMAIRTIGNCHGPGYPLFLMISRLFAWVFPFGSLAFRVSVLSAIFSAAAACLIYWAVFRMSSSRLGGAVAAIAFAFSYTIWYQTVIPETYALNTFFIALLTVLALRWERVVTAGDRTRADNAMAVFAFVFGLAVTNHYTVIFLLPAFIFFALDTDMRQAMAPRNILRMAAFFAIGLLPYVYQPAAAFRGPGYNYGDPSTLTRWFHHMTLYYQRGGLFKYPLPLFGPRFFRYFGTLLTEFPYAFWLAAIGLIASFKLKKVKYGLFLVMMFLFSALAVMSYDQLESVLRAHFYYPSYLIVSLWIGFGAAGLIALVKRLTAKRDRLVTATAVGLAGIVVLALVAVSIPVHYAKVDKSDYSYAREMAVKMLRKAEPDGIIITDSDNVIFPLKYLQLSEGIGTEVNVVNPKSLGVPGWPGADLDRAIPAPGTDVSPQDPTYMRLAKKNYDRLPFYSSGLTFVFTETPVQWQGLLDRIYPPGAAEQPGAAIEVTTGHEDYGDMDSDARESVLLPWALDAYARITEGDVKGAEKLFGKAADYGVTKLYVPTLYGCETVSFVFDLWAQMLEKLGNYPKIVDEMPRAREVNPDFVSLPYARALSQVGQNSKALDELNKYVTVYPGVAEAYTQRGEVQTQMGLLKDAKASFEQAIELNPEDPRQRYGLGVILLQMDDVKGAVRELRTAYDKGAGAYWGVQSKALLDSISSR